MSEPRRWLHDAQLTDDVRALLEAGEAPPHMPPAERRRVGLFVTRVAAGLAATSLLFSAKVVAAVLAVSVGSVATWAVVEQRQALSASQPQAQVSATVRPRAARPARASTPALPHALPTSGSEPAPAQASLVAASTDTTTAEPSAPAAAATPSGPRTVRQPEPPRREAHVVPAQAELASLPSVAMVSVPPPAAGEAPDTASAPQDPLAAEATILEQARAQLALEPALALARAEQHRALFTDGQLAAERELIAIDALGRLGRTAEARARADALVTRQPGSMYVRRARRLSAVSPSE
jgi:hypothetical protein